MLFLMSQSFGPISCLEDIGEGGGENITARLQEKKQKEEII